MNVTRHLDRSTYSVNCSILFTHLPLVERPAAARAAGFDAVEFWWPFASSTPDSSEVDTFLDAISGAGVQLTGLNFNAGDMSAGDRGLVSWPTRAADFRANLDVVTAIGERSGCRKFNALYGSRIDDIDPAEQERLGAQNLAFASKAVARIDGTVLVEPLSGALSYPLRTAADVMAVLDHVTAEHGVTNLGLLMDVYHLALNGSDVSSDIALYGDRIGHVQLADAPGRGAPGTGELPLFTWLDALRGGGYSGPVGLEYQVDGDSDPFGWLHVNAR